MSINKALARKREKKAARRRERARRNYEMPGYAEFTRRVDADGTASAMEWLQQQLAAGKIQIPDPGPPDPDTMKRIGEEFEITPIDPAMMPALQRAFREAGELGPNSDHCPICELMGTPHSAN